MVQDPDPVYTQPAYQPRYDGYGYGYGYSSKKAHPVFAEHPGKGRGKGLRKRRQGHRISLLMRPLLYPGRPFLIDRKTERAPNRRVWRHAAAHPSGACAPVRSRGSRQ